MEATYNYNTGIITRDFSVVREFEPIKGYAKCRLSGLPCYINSERCRKCSHYGGIISPLEVGIDGFYIKCDHPEQKDSENIDNILSAYYNWIQKKALKAL